jgi:LPS-assembly protein
MKNKNIEILKTFIFFLTFSLIATFANSKDLNIKAQEIITLENGNLIIGNKKAEAKIPNEIEIFADKITYNKINETLNAEGNVLVIDLVDNIRINSNKITYDKVKNELISHSNSKFNIDNKYTIDSENVYLDINKKILSSDEKTLIKDNFNNNITTSSFKYFNFDETLKAQSIELIDNEQNRYLLENGMIKLKEKILIGKDTQVFLRNDSFGIPENEPKLKGNSLYYENNNIIVSKGIFTSCKSNNNCPPWSITSKEIKHDKKKQEIHYTNAWLRIYNIPVLYFPKFFHPDPSVDRKSGFLKPGFGDSKNLGSSVTVPYFNVISESKDLTFKPRIFSKTEYLLQSEYRQENKNSSHIIDFSVNKTDNDKKNGRKTHFFSNSKFNFENEIFDETFIDLKIEKVSNDGYIDLYSLESTSPIIKDTSTLENLVELSASNNDLSFDLSIESYETMNEINSDRYEFVYPNYSINKSIVNDNNFFSNIDLASTGNQKTYSTNIFEAIQVNDLILTSENFYSKFGLVNSVKTLIKNVNSKGKNSSKLKDSKQSEILSLFAYDINLPLFKNSQNYKNLLTPTASFRHSPNKGKNIKNEDRLINTDNLFSLNRVGYNETIEGGTSLTLGVKYDKRDKDNRLLISSNIGTVFRDEENENLPTRTTLNKKNSDIVGELIYQPVDNFKIDYDYLINPDLDEVNLHKLTNTLTVNNFVNTFSFYEENNIIGSNSYYENSFTYNMNQNNSLAFKTRENKKNNLTEYYNLVYEYKNDCLTASIVYNKEYYSNATTKPSEDLFFNITLIPLGATETDSLID